jgi:DNA processing protein
MLREYFEARLVTTAAEVAEEAGAIGELADRPRAAEGIRDRLPRPLQDLLEAMPSREWITGDALADVTGLTREAVTAGLVELHDQALVERCPDGYRITALGRAPAATLLDL